MLSSNHLHKVAAVGGDFMQLQRLLPAPTLSRLRCCQGLHLMQPFRSRAFGLRNCPVSPIHHVSSREACSSDSAQPPSQRFSWILGTRFGNSSQRCKMGGNVVDITILYVLRKRPSAVFSEIGPDQCVPCPVRHARCEAASLPNFTPPAGDGNMSTAYFLWSIVNSNFSSRQFSTPEGQIHMAMRIWPLGAVLLVVSLLASGRALAQGIVVAGAGPINRSMAGASVAAPIDAAGAMFWNPAAISGLKASQILFGAEFPYTRTTISSSAAAGSLGPGIPPSTWRGGTRVNPAWPCCRPSPWWFNRTTRRGRSASGCSRLGASAPTIRPPRRTRC